MKIREIMKRCMLKIAYGYSTSEEYVNWLKKRGVSIGEGTRFYSPQHINIDITRPFAITIGKNTHITKNVTILTHGFDAVVLKGMYNDVLGSFGEVVIGDNVFIGTGALIQKGVHIGNNVIIGAASVVTKDCLESGVYIGSPAEMKYTIEEYYKKRVDAQITEAKSLVKAYYKRYRRFPNREYLDEFFFIFENRDCNLLDVYKYQMKNNGAFDECLHLFNEGHRQVYKSYDDFIEECSQDVE